jgi:hypothetical protein
MNEPSGAMGGLYSGIQEVAPPPQAPPPIPSRRPLGGTLGRQPRVAAGP